jgi:predicted metal-dependent hydrolase
MSAPGEQREGEHRMKETVMEIDALEKGIALFNEGKYFEAHEAWEYLWLDEHDEAEKRFYQGLIMAAGAMLHYTRRECAGASVLLGRSIPMIQEGVSSHPNLRIGDFIRALDGLRDEFSRCSYNVSTESLPKISRMYIYC